MVVTSEGAASVVDTSVEVSAVGTSPAGFIPAASVDCTADASAEFRHRGLGFAGEPFFYGGNYAYPYYAYEYDDDYPYSGSGSYAYSSSCRQLSHRVRVHGTWHWRRHWVCG